MSRRSVLIGLAAATVPLAGRRRAAAAEGVEATIAPASPVRRGQRLWLRVRSAGRRSVAVRDSSGAAWRLESDDGVTARFSRWA